MLNLHKINSLFKHNWYIFQLTCFDGEILKLLQNFILIQGSVKKQLGSGFRDLLDPERFSAGSGFIEYRSETLISRKVKDEVEHEP